jgi:cytochrome b involved in lipid metabolism
MKTLFKSSLYLALVSVLFGSSISASAGSQLPTEDSSNVSSVSQEITASPANTVTYTTAEVATRNTKTNCWTIVSGSVYNLTSYINSHPGGVSAISQLCGKDGTATFNGQHMGDSSPISRLATLKIGTHIASATSCTPGSYLENSTKRCVIAPVGYFVSASSASAGQTFANPCPLGSFTSNQGSVECQLAPIGSYVDLTAQSSAKPCPEGQTTDQTGSVSIDSCYTPIVFIECEIGSYFNEETVSCELAPKGYYVDTRGASAPLICGLGTFSSELGSSSCSHAQPGTYVDTQGAVASTACSVGTYSPVSGSDRCIVAPIGFYVSQTEQTSAEACPAGKTTDSPGATSIEDCFTPQVFIDCDPGYFFSDRTGECLPAPAGSYVDLAGATAATKCPAGTYSSVTGSLSCQLTTFGYFTATEGSVQATPCAPGSLSNIEGASTCELVPAGYFTSEPASSNALPCPQGFFSANEGSAACTPAPAGYSVPDEASSEALPCEPGRFSSEEGMVDCEQAPAGYFVSTTAATQAIPCSKGFFAASEGSVSCMKVPRGFYVSTVAATRATICSKGLTTASTGATSSTSCYKPILQVLTGFKAPTALKYSAKTNLIATTTAKAVTSFKTTGPCSAKIITLTTKVKGKNVSSKVLSVTAGKTAGTCKIVQTSPEVGKYAAFTKTTSIKISRTGK